MKPFEKLQTSWRGEEPPYDRAVTHDEAAVAALEARYGVTLPADFRDYLLHACPTADDGGVMDAHNSAWWGLDRLQSGSEELARPLSDAALEAERASALFFADHMIWCMAWAICCNPGPNYGRILVCSGHDHFVADSFAAFVDQYLIDDRSLL